MAEAGVCSSYGRSAPGLARLREEERDEDVESIRSVPSDIVEGDCVPEARGLSTFTVASVSGSAAPGASSSDV